MTIRTLDVGGDKLAPALADRHGACRQPGARPARDPPLAEASRELLDAQLAAMLRAGAHGPVRILLPMISSVSRGQAGARDPAPLARRLKRRGVKIPDPLPPLGVMIEVPGAALAADALAQVADFFAIGTNDLTMYTLAIDRGDEQVAPSLQPAASGGAAADPVRDRGGARARASRSASAARSPAIRALRRCCSASASASCRWRANPAAGQAAHPQPRLRRRHPLRPAIMDQSDSGRIATLLDDFNSLA